MSMREAIAYAIIILFVAGAAAICAFATLRRRRRDHSYTRIDLLGDRKL
jgi:hypothetical protein